MGKGLNSCGQEQAMWMLGVFLAVDRPGKVDVKGRCVPGSGTSGFKWVVGLAQYGIWKRESNGFVIKVVIMNQTVPCWLVGCVMPV